MNISGVVCVGGSPRFPRRVQCEGVFGTLDSMAESLKCQVMKFGLDVTARSSHSLLPLRVDSEYCASRRRTVQEEVSASTGSFFLLLARNSKPVLSLRDRQVTLLLMPQEEMQPREVKGFAQVKQQTHAKGRTLTPKVRPQFQP